MGITSEKVVQSKLELALPFMVPELFEMIYLRETSVIEWQTDVGETEVHTDVGKT